MPALNKVQVIGNLGKDPEKRFTPNGKPVTTFSMAINRRWAGEDGQNRESTTWVNVETWNTLAENCAKYLKKGSLVYVEGRLQTDQYEKDGQTHHFTKVVAADVQFLTGRNESGEAVATESGGEDIPF